MSTSNGPCYAVIERQLDEECIPGSSTSDKLRRKGKPMKRRGAGLNSALPVVDGHTDEPPSKRRIKSPGEMLKTTSPRPGIDFEGLGGPRRSTGDRREENDGLERLEKMRGAVRTLLECVGENPDRDGLLDTPSRYAKALLFFTKGYQTSLEDIMSSNALFHENHNEMIIVRNIEIYSLCEHHLVPFTGKVGIALTRVGLLYSKADLFQMHIGYIPSDTVIGLSKLPRIADMFARRLQIQERLTKEVARAVTEILKPQGVGVVMESSHVCMVMRGVEKATSTTITSCVGGCFKRNSRTRNEFLNLVGIYNR